ncbi:putative gnat family protein [Botrytis fragariae]|uniref:Putative gnat family protein n=1 Tax=Botrytis fragariae TaxID=1964551 RepID=A0A8H6B0P7_9HELO|nr:putative gnat family protein [Botrytis fragariae]KAF5877033.1 putative gnat family protein [Botrytis fragariae]
MAITHPHPINIANSNSSLSSKPNYNDKTNVQITLLPITKADLPRIALLEHLAFEEDEFSDLAFGKERGSPEALKMRERQFEKFLDKAEKGGEEEGGWYCKAVLGLMGKEKEKGGEDREKEGSLDSPTGSEEEGKTRIKTKEELEEIWGKGSNVQLCEDVFVRGDEYMFGACGREKWLKLNILVIHPSHQRRGIGTLLLEQGLKFADEKSLQVVLGASPWGIGLYRKYGFVDVHGMDIQLDRYEGGEGMGSTRHVIMRRPPRGVE